MTLLGPEFGWCPATSGPGSLPAVGEPAVPSPEGLGLGGLGVAYNAEPIVVGVEADDAVIPDPELLPAAGVVEVGYAFRGS